MKTISEIDAIRQKVKPQVEMRRKLPSYQIIVGMATSGIAAGARNVIKTLIEQIEQKDLTNIIVTQNGFSEASDLEPVMEVVGPDGEKVTYVKIDSEKAAMIVSQHIIGGKIVKEYTNEFDEY